MDKGVTIYEFFTQRRPHTNKENLTNAITQCGLQEKRIDDQNLISQMEYALYG